MPKSMHNSLPKPSSQKCLPITAKMCGRRKPHVTEASTKIIYINEPIRTMGRAGMRRETEIYVEFDFLKF